MREVKNLESIEVLCYNVTKMLKKKGLHKCRTERMIQKIT